MYNAAARLVTIMLTVTALTACTTNASESTYTRVPDPVVETVASGLRIPWGLAFLPDGRALVTERGNLVRDQLPAAEAIPRIVSVSADGKVTEIQKLPEVSTLTGEGGLLGTATSKASHGIRAGACSRPSWARTASTSSTSSSPATITGGRS